MAIQWPPQRNRPVLRTGSPRGRKEKKAFLYGALYVDEHESWALVTEQIDGLMLHCERPRAQIMLGFDIVCTPGQIQAGKGTETARQILAYVDQRYPGIYRRVVGVTDNDDRRPIRDTMMTRTLSEEDIDDVHLFTYE